MATLQELNGSVQRINSQLESYRGQVNEAVIELRKEKSNIKDFNKAIREIVSKMEAIDKLMPSLTNDATKEDLKKQREDLEQRLKTAESNRDRVQDLINSKTAAEENIRLANEEMDKIVLEFASDPRINSHLQEAIEVKYDGQIEKKNEEKTSQIELNKKFSLDLKNNDVFGKLVTSLAESYRELKQIPDIILDEETKKKASVTRGRFTKNLNALRSAISARPEYKNLNLSEEDFEQIIAGPNSEGEYVLPTLEDRVKSIEKVTTSLEDRKAKLVAKVKGALVPERVDPAELARLDAEIQSATTREQTAQAELTRIQGQIDALKQTFTTVDVTAEEQALKDAKDELKNIEAKIQANRTHNDTLSDKIKDLAKKILEIGFDQTRFDELNREADVPAELTTKKATAETEFEKAKKALKVKGYISEDLYPEMKNYTAEIDAFRKADKNVRKAFLECETNDSPENREALKKAMEAYKTSSGALTKLSGMEGLTVENWHDWLVRDLRNKNKEEVLADYYYDDTVDLRLDGVRDEYKKLFKKSHTLDDSLGKTEDALKKVKDMQEAFLRGDNVEFADVETGLDNYKNTITKLFDNLKDKGAKGLNKIEDLWGRLQGKLAKLNIFQRIFRRRAEEPINVSGSKPRRERDELKRLEEDFKAKKQAVADVDKDIEEHEKTKLGDAKYKELKELREKEAQAFALHSKIRKIQQEQGDLGVEFADLVTEETKAESNVQAKQQELDAARANGTATPEQQADLAKLEADRNAQEQERIQAEQARIKAEQEKANLKPTRPKEVVKDARTIAHEKGRDVKDAAIEHFEKKLDEGR